MKTHTYQEDWFRLKAIYNDFYGDPSKGIDIISFLPTNSSYFSLYTVESTV